ncbi:MAG: hypothetical protein ACOYNN_04160 [Terrimicrobiaceae bacterium]
MITAQIDTRGFDEVLRKLASSTKRPMREVTLAESKAILQTTLDRTKILTKQVLKFRVRRKFNQYGGGDFGRASRGVTPKISIAPNVGRTWWVEPGPKFYIVAGGERRWSDERWERYQAEEADRKADMPSITESALRRRGLPKQSWYFLADTLGYSLKATQDVIGATVKRRELREVVTSVLRETSSEFEVHGTNYSTSTQRADGRAVLARTMEGRVKYFRMNLEKGVFASLDQIHRAYPNLLKINR